MSDDLDLSITLRAIDKFSEPARKIAQSSAKMAKHLGEGQKALYKLGNNKKAIKNMADMEQRLGGTATAIEKTRREVVYYRRQMELVGKKEGKVFVGLLDKARSKQEKLLQSQQRQNVKLTEMSRRLKGAGIDTKHLGKEQERLGQIYDRTKKKLEGYGKLAAKLQAAEVRRDRSLQKAANVTLMAGGISQVGQSLTGALKVPIREAIDFESAMADVRKVVNFKEPDGLKKLSNTLVKMTRTIPIAKEGLAAIAAAGGQLGVKEGSLPTFVETVAKMSTAFDMLPDEAGNAMAKLSNIYNIPIKEMTRLGDAINHLSNNSGAAAREIVPVLRRAGGVGRQFGLSAIQVAALGDAFIALGMQPERAGTAINAMLSKMQTADRQGEKFQAGLAAIGMNASGLQKSIGKDAQGALTGFMERLAKLDNQTRSGVLADMFGLEYAPALSLLAGGLDKYSHALNLVAKEANFAGSMETEFQQRSNTTANRIQLMQQRWAAVQQRIGDKLLPILEKLMNVLEPMIDGFGWLIETFPTASTVVMTLVGGMGVLALGIAPVITAVASLSVAMAHMGMTARRAKLNAAMGGGGGGGAWGKTKGIGRALGNRAGGIGAVLGALSIGSTLMSDDTSGNDKIKSVSRDVGGIGGALAGAAAGAAIGSVIPVVGTAIGGAVGAMLGSGGGEWLGEKVGGWFADDEPPMAAQGGSSSVNNTTQNITQNIVPHPDESPQAFADRLKDGLQQLQQQQAGSAMYDPA
ncbi:MAG: phage tail tape measure protein [Candidatus Sedimenticola sp. (ex Thyasira tokunagai)]